MHSLPSSPSTLQLLGPAWLTMSCLCPSGLYRSLPPSSVLPLPAQALASCLGAGVQLCPLAISVSYIPAFQPWPPLCEKKKKSQFCLLLERAVNYGYDSIGTLWKYLENNIMAWTNVAMIFQVFLPTVLKLSTIKSLFFNDMSTWYLWARPEPPLTTVLSKLAKIKYLSPQRVCSCWPLCLVMRCCLPAF